jgi:hypothetical protein
MKTFRDIFNEIFDPLSITIYVATFVGALVFFLLICDDTFLIALKNSFLIAIAIIVLTIFGRYVDEFEKKKE